MTQLSHSWYDSDKENELEITVNVDDDGVVEEVVDLAYWEHEEGRRRNMKAMLNLEMCEAANMIDPLLEQVDWHMKLHEHKVEEREYNEVCRNEES